MSEQSLAPVSALVRQAVEEFLQKNGSTMRRKPPNAEICITTPLWVARWLFVFGNAKFVYACQPHKDANFPQSTAAVKRCPPWRDVPVSRVRNSCSLAVPLSEFLLVFSFGAASGFYTSFCCRNLSLCSG